MSIYIDRFNWPVVLGTHLDPMGDHWDNALAAPTARYLERMKEGHFKWTNISGVPRDMMYLYWLAAGRQLTEITRVVCIPEEDTFTGITSGKGPDVIQTTEPESIMWQLRKWGGLKRPEFGGYAWKQNGLKSTVEQIGDETIVRGRYWMVEELDDQTVLKTYVRNDFKLVKVTQDYANEWIKRMSAQSKTSAEGSLRYIETHPNDVMGQDHPSKIMSRCAYRAAILFGHLPNEPRPVHRTAKVA